MKNYACPKKIEARHQTVIGAYQAIFLAKLPKCKQYWTLCARQVDADGLLNGSELQQILEARLITERQFHGVDKDERIIELNRKHLPKAHWYCDNLYTVLSNASPFDPAIVNCGPH